MTSYRDYSEIIGSRSTYDDVFRDLPKSDHCHVIVLDGFFDDRDDPYWPDILEELDDQNLGSWTAIVREHRDLLVFCTTAHDAMKIKMIWG